MADLNGLRMVIFDNDGVLVDSWDANVWFYNAVRKRLELTPMTPEEEQFCFAATVSEGIRGTVPADRYGEAMAVVHDLGPDAVIPRVKRKEGARDFLALLNQRRIKTAVMTNGGHEALPLLRNVGLFEFLAQIVTADDVRQAKPSGDGLRRILTTHQIDPHAALFIGDSLHDQQAAADAGVPFWAFNNTKLKAQRHIAGFDEAIKVFTGVGPLPHL